MLRRSFRLGLTLGLLAGVVFALIKVLGGRADHASAPAAAPSGPWPPLPAEPTTTWVPAEAGAPAAPVPAPAVAHPTEPASTAGAGTKAPLEAAPENRPPAGQAAGGDQPAAATWVVPEGQVCPTSHPVKARLSSGIFHVPGMLNYLRTRPDRCYRDAASAEADGLRAAKR